MLKVFSSVEDTERHFFCILIMLKTVYLASSHLKNCKKSFLSKLLEKVDILKK